MSSGKWRKRKRQRLHRGAFHAPSAAVSLSPLTLTSKSPVHIGPPTPRGLVATADVLDNAAPDAQRPNKFRGVSLGIARAGFSYRNGVSPEQLALLAQAKPAAPVIRMVQALSTFYTMPTPKPHRMLRKQEDE